MKKLYDWTWKPLSGGRYRCNQTKQVVKSNRIKPRGPNNHKEPPPDPDNSLPIVEMSLFGSARCPYCDWRETGLDDRHCGQRHDKNGVKVKCHHCNKRYKALYPKTGMF